LPELRHFTQCCNFSLLASISLEPSLKFFSLPVDIKPVKKGFITVSWLGFSTIKQITIRCM